MVMTSEMKEILAFLDSEKEYVIFAGFASFLHTGVESSADIDAFVPSFEEINRMADEFVKKGWELTKNEKFCDDAGVKTVEKNGTTFDICLNQHVNKVFFPVKVEVSFEELTLQVLSLEGLFLTTLKQITGKSRTEAKMKRDRETIELLRKKIDVKRLKELIMSTADTFWTERHF